MDQKSHIGSSEPSSKIDLLLLYTFLYRHLAGEIAGEWAETDFSENTEIRDKLIQLTKQIVPYNMAHNAEAEACDLLMEIERLDLLEQYVDENIYNRVCLYLTRYVFIGC